MYREMLFLIPNYRDRRSRTSRTKTLACLDGEKSKLTTRLWGFPYSQVVFLYHSLPPNNQQWRPGI